MSWLTGILRKPYPYYIPFRSSFKLILGFTILFPLALVVFKPFNIGNWDCAQKTYILMGMSLPIFLSLTLNFYGITWIMPQPFKEDLWTVGREFLWSVWNIASVGFLIGIYLEVLPICNTGIGHIPTYAMNTFLMAVLPSWACILYNQFSSLRQKLNEAEDLNRKLTEKQSAQPTGEILLKGENIDERLKIGIDDLLFIQSYDNYSKVVTFSEPSPNSELIRSSLKNLQVQINESYIVRCHRSYIVNLLNVESVTGNAREFRLNLRGHTDPIPVSRDNARIVMKLLKDLG